MGGRFKICNGIFMLHCVYMTRFSVTLIHCSSTGSLLEYFLGVHSMLCRAGSSDRDALHLSDWEASPVHPPSPAPSPAGAWHRKGFHFFLADTSFCRESGAQVTGHGRYLAIMKQRFTAGAEGRGRWTFRGWTWNKGFSFGAELLFW